MLNARSEHNAYCLYMYRVCGVWQIFDTRHRNRFHAPQITTIVNQASVIFYNWQQKFWLSALIIAANI